MTITAEQQQQLRAPFKPSEVGKLPRLWCRDCRDSKFKACDKHPARTCAECGQKHSTAALHLDYVGHAEVTDRLLDVDPLWNWEPMALDAAGLPLLDRNGGLWMRLTICGVTRLCYGDAQGKSGGDAIKELIGDAIRNGAFRQGVALDLWRKTEKADQDGAQRAAEDGVADTTTRPAQQRRTAAAAKPAAASAEGTKPEAAAAAADTPPPAEPDEHSAPPQPDPREGIPVAVQKALGDDFWDILADAEGDMLIDVIKELRKTALQTKWAPAINRVDESGLRVKAKLADRAKVEQRAAQAAKAKPSDDPEGPQYTAEELAEFAVRDAEIAAAQEAASK